MDNANKIFNDENDNAIEKEKILYSRSQDDNFLVIKLDEENKGKTTEEIDENKKNLAAEEIFEIDNENNLLEEQKDVFLEERVSPESEEINISNAGKEEGGKANVIEIFTIKKKLLKIKEEIDEILKELESEKNFKEYEKKFTDVLSSEQKDDNLDIGAAKIIEGIFDGFEMIAEDVEKYEVPANYASKSKLVEGDILKLRILHNGAYRYKQIEKVRRKNAVGILNYNEETKEYFVVADNGRKYKVLTASITYYKVSVGDEIIITIPDDGESKWAAVEGIG